MTESQEAPPPRRPWVALYGPAGCGKDTIAAHLVESFGFTRVAFADPVRQMALAIDPYVNTETVLERPELISPIPGITRLSTVVESVGWETAKRDYPEVRRLLQTIGTDAVRSVHPDFWVELALKAAMAAEGAVVFTDTRFPNEVGAIRYFGGMVARVDREVDSIGSHVSESALHEVAPDLILQNIGPIEETPLLAAAVIRRLLTP